MRVFIKTFIGTKVTNNMGSASIYFLSFRFPLLEAGTMAPADTQLAATEGDLTVGERRSRSRTSVNKFTRGSHFFFLSSLLTRVRIQEKKRKLYPENKMPPSYKALLQSIDETDVSKGLGRSIKAPRRRKCFCCRRLCLLCTCIILMILIPVLAILGVYLVSPTSLLPFKEWFHWDDIHWFQVLWKLISRHHHYISWWQFIFDEIILFFSFIISNSPLVT